MGALQGCMTKNQNLRKDSNDLEIAAVHLQSQSESDNITYGNNTRITEVSQYNRTRVGPAELDNQEIVVLRNQHSEITVSEDESIHYIPEAEIIRDRNHYPDVTPEPSLNKADSLSGSIDSVEDMSLNSTSCQVAIQKPAPFFQGPAVVNGEFKEISLEDYKGKYVVLFFYPLDFTFVCPTEIIAFSDRADDFSKIGCELIACSTDSQFSHHAWVNTPRKNGGLGEMNIPMLADKTGNISRKYGVYKEDEGIAYRGLFIIDGKQNIRQITINDLPVGRSVDETLRLVQAFQFTDKHGEVCPAGWKPGAKTIKPSLRESKAYFENTGN